jgi:hypothetical protein
MALDETGLCEVCDDRIEEPRQAVGLKTCWRCSAADQHSPPWEIEGEKP